MFIVQVAQVDKVLTQLILLFALHIFQLELLFLAKMKKVNYKIKNQL